jgi:hypothetical protein
MAAFTSSKEGRYDVFFELRIPMGNYKEEMTAFNKATDELLSQLISLIGCRNCQQIMISHRYGDLYDKVAAAGSKTLPHPPMVLVQTARRANHAVCDGYSLAYEFCFSSRYYSDRHAW